MINEPYGLKVDLDRILVKYAKNPGSVKKGDWVWVSDAENNDGVYSLMRIKVGEVCEQGGAGLLKGKISVSPAKETVHTGFGRLYMLFDKDRDKMKEIAEAVLRDIYDSKIEEAKAVLKLMHRLKRSIREEPLCLHTAKSLVMGATALRRNCARVPGRETGYFWDPSDLQSMAGAVDMLRKDLEEDMEK